MVHVEIASPYDQDKFVNVRVPWELTGKEMACGAVLARTALDVAAGKYQFARYMLTPVSAFAIDVLAKCTVADKDVSGAPNPDDAGGAELRSRVFGLLLASKYLFQEVEPALKSNRQLLVSVMRGMARELYQKGGEFSLRFICERLSADGYPYAPKRARQIAALFASELQTLSSIASVAAAAASAAVVATPPDHTTETPKSGSGVSVDGHAVTVTLEAPPTVALPTSVPEIVVVPAVPTTPLNDLGVGENADRPQSGGNDGCEGACPIGEVAQHAPSDATTSDVADTTEPVEAATTATAGTPDDVNNA